MYWLFLLLALGAFMLALSTTQAWLLALAMLAALVFMLLWARGLYIARIGGVVSGTARILHPAELQALREKYRTGAAPSPDHSRKQEPS